jgi:hypothetical protein
VTKFWSQTPDSDLGALGHLGCRMTSCIGFSTGVQASAPESSRRYGPPQYRFVCILDKRKSAVRNRAALLLLQIALSQFRSPSSSVDWGDRTAEWLVGKKSSAFGLSRYLALLSLVSSEVDHRRFGMVASRTLKSPLIVIRLVGGLDAGKPH